MSGTSLWLIPAIKRRIRENRNFIAIFTGDTGSGKSWAAIRLAELIDPSFNADRIVFTVQDFMHLINSPMTKGSVIIFDDAGLGINAREWQKTAQKLFSMVMQGFRYKQINVFFTVPKLFMIDRQSRALAHMHFMTTNIQGSLKMYVIRENKYNPDQPLEMFPKIHRSGHTVVIKIVRFAKPSSKLADKYETNKHEYMDSLFQGYEKEILEKNKQSKNKEENKDLKSEKLKQIICKMHENGNSERGIATITGIPHSTIHRIVAEGRGGI